jgi:hypothetical protein
MGFSHSFAGLRRKRVIFADAARPLLAPARPPAYIAASPASRTQDFSETPIGD